MHSEPSAPDSFTNLLPHPTSGMISTTEDRVTQPCAQGPFRRSRWTENGGPLKQIVRSAVGEGPSWCVVLKEGCPSEVG